MSGICVGPIKIHHIYDFDTYYYGLYIPDTRSNSIFHINTIEFIATHWRIMQIHSYLMHIINNVYDVIKWQEALFSSPIIIIIIIIICIFVHLKLLHNSQIFTIYSVRIPMLFCSICLDLLLYNNSIEFKSLNN